MDKSGLEASYHKPLDIIMEEYHPNNQAGLMGENFNVEIHGNSVDTHYHHGAITSNAYGGAYHAYDIAPDTSYHYTKNIDLGKSYKNNRFVEGYQNNIEFYSKGPPNIETDFRAHMDYNNQLVMAANQLTERNTVSPEGFQELMEETKKEIDAAGTAVDNLGFNYSQDVKTVFHDLSKRLDNSQNRWLTELNDGNNTAAVKDVMINNLTDMLAKEKVNSEEQKKLSDWQAEELERRQEDFSTKLADKFRDRKVKQNVINTLRGNMMSGWKIKCEEATKKRTEDVCRQLKGKYTAAQDKLNEEIAKLKGEQAKLAQEKADYEAAVQQGLMKGLCSLNMEALRVFKLKLDPSGPDVTWQTPSQESNNVAHNPSQPHITRADSENLVGLSPSLIVIMENSKDKGNTPADLEAFVNRSVGQPRTVRSLKKNESESSEGTNKKSKNLRLPPNYQVIKLLKRPNSATSTKKK